MEPNGRNPLIRLQTRLVPAETGAREFDTHLIARWLAVHPVCDIQIRTSQPFPLRRMVLHYRFGFPSLGRYRLLRWSLRTAESLIGKLLPSSRWSYIIAIARRQETEASS